MVSTRSISDIPEGPLVSTTWLEANLDNPRVRVLDVRGRHPSSSLPHAKHAEFPRRMFRARCSSIGNTILLPATTRYRYRSPPRGRSRGTPGRSASAMATWW